MLAWKLAKMPPFVYLSITTAFFSGLANLFLSFFIFSIKLRDQKYSKLMEPKFLRKFSLWQHYGRIFSQDWHVRFVSYLAWRRSTWNSGSQVLLDNSCLPENWPKWLRMLWFVCLSIMTRTCFAPYIFAIWLLLVSLLPSYSKNDCDVIFQHSSFLN